MIDPEAKRAALALLARGVITVPEAARLAGASRQLVAHWAKRAETHWARVREARITKLWRKAMARPRN